MLHLALPAFGTLYLSSIVFSYGENGGKLLLAVRATIVIARHPLSLLSFGRFRQINDFQKVPGSVFHFDFSEPWALSVAASEITSSF